MKKIEFKKDDSQREENEQDIETESSRLSTIEYYRYSNKKYPKNKCYKDKYYKLIFVIFITLFIFIVFFFISYRMANIISNIKDNRNKNSNLLDLNKFLNISNGSTINNISKNIENIITQNIKEDNITNNSTKKKIGLAFLYSTLYSNGIARFITLTANYLMKTGNYDICFITKKPYSKEYKYNSNIKRFIAFDNYTLIRNITKHENIDIFILQNVISRSAVKFYHSLGKKVIGMFHGVYMSAMAMDHLNSFKNWIDFDYFDSYVFIAADDYYFYKKLGFKNEIYIPNLNAFEPSETKSSNLTYNNIIMLGRQNDPIKGAKYAVKSMSYVIKEVPDAKLILVTSDSRVQFLRDLIKELNLTNNVFIHSHTYNISSYFWNSSIHMYTSLSEAYPMAMIEGKAHGLPILAFDVPYSPPYQEGIIPVTPLDVEELAKKTILLLKDYNYRKRIGEKAKESLNKYSNDDIVEIWQKLFRALLSSDINDYRKLQNEIENKYYNEEEAYIRMQKSYEFLKKSNKNLTCHYLENFTDINYVKNIKLCNISNHDFRQNL